MASLRCVVAGPARLLVRATEGLFPLAASSPANPWPTLPAWMVLRQGGLRDDLHALAGSMGVAGWFDPPICLFAEMAARWTDDVTPSLSAQDRAALLSSLLSRHARGVFGRSGGVESWVPSVDSFIGDLVGEGITADALERAMRSRTSRDTFECARDDALVAIYRAWLAELARLGRTDGRDSLVRLAAAILADPETFAKRLGRRRDIRIIGLADLRGGWSQLLTALAASAAIDSLTVFASHAIGFPASLTVETEIDDIPHQPSSAAIERFVEAPDAAREVEIVATRVRALLDAGVDASRIAVVARQARPLVDDVSAALESLGVPVTARRRVSLAHTAPARALCALLGAATQSWSRHAVLELAEHPLLSLGLDASVLDFVGMEAPRVSIDEWSSALETLHARAVARERRETQSAGHEYERPLPPSAHVYGTVEAWRIFAPHAHALEGKRAAADWFGWAHGVMTLPAWCIAQRLESAPAGDVHVLRTEYKAQQRIAALMEEWQQALETFGSDGDALIDAERFVSQLALALTEDLILQPETGFGVVVGEALAAGWRSFDHLFVVGLASGEFPRRMPVSPLLSESDRNALIAAGLPLDPSSAWRDRERELFRVLCAAPTSSLVLSWPAMDAEGREVARSSFVDERIELAVSRAGVSDTDAPETELALRGIISCVLPSATITAGFPMVSRHAPATAILHAQRVAEIERNRLRTLSPWNGEITDSEIVAELERRYGPQYVWSATSLEELAKCPYSWMAKRVLRLETRAEADDAIEPTVTGRILHSALQRFFDTERERRGAAVYLTAADTTTAASGIAVALDDAWAAESTVAWLGVPALRPIVKAELLTQLQKYLQFEIAYNEKSSDNRTTASKNIRTGAVLGEFAFDGVTITTGNGSFLLRGSIDRVDESADTRIGDDVRYLAAIDYKSSKYSTPAAGDKAGWDDGVVLQVPLYAEVMRQLMPDGDLARLEYRTLRSPEVVHQLQFVSVQSSGKPGNKTFAAVGSEEAYAQFTAALDAAGRRVLQARAGEFPAGPAPSCGCSPFCAARDVCRIPGGPV